MAAPAEPLRRVLDRMHITSPRLPLVANVTGERYPADPEEIKDMLAKQIASPVQWVKGVETLYAEGVRTFVEVGPKKALKGLVDDVLANRPDVISLSTNHPKPGALATFNQALCGLYAAGYGGPSDRTGRATRAVMSLAAPASTAAPAPVAQPVTGAAAHPGTGRYPGAGGPSARADRGPHRGGTRHR